MDNKCIRVGIVNYLNTRPLIMGLQQMHDAGNIQLSQQYPSQVAQQLIDGKIDIGLVPVAIIPAIKNAQIIGNYCIAADDAVASVGLYSQVPVAEIKTVYLDFQSRTSIQLVQILFKKYWQQEVQFLPAPENYMQLITGTTAGVIIGDRALQYKTNFTFEYDLAATWKLLTGLPFVFAAWVSNVAIDAAFVLHFDKANAIGFNYLDEIVASINYPYYDLKKYYTQNIKYNWDAEKRKGLELFLREMGN
jgi:chorismate dehydratase